MPVTSHNSNREVRQATALKRESEPELSQQMSPQPQMGPLAEGRSTAFLQVRVAEDARFELARGCPQHAFQQC
jgi:hypothetical protein